MGTFGYTEGRRWEDRENTVRGQRAGVPEATISCERGLDRSLPGAFGGRMAWPTP